MLFFFRYFVVIALIVSCSSERPVGNTEAEILFREAKELKEKERYLLAIEKLNLIKSQHPYSFYSAHAELMLADIQFLQENYIESAASYLIFRDLHPKYEKMEYVVWRLAESYFNQLPSGFDRDLSPSFDASIYYKEILQKYPNGEYAQKAKERMEVINANLRNKDFYIANFYFKTGDYDASSYRYEIILNSWKDEKSEKLGLIGLLNSYYNLEKYQDCVAKFHHWASLKSSSEDEIQKIYKNCSAKL